MAQPITVTDVPDRTFDNTNTVLAVAVFPNKRHMVTGSTDRMLRLWDLENGVNALKTMEGHRGFVRAVAVSQERKLIASADRGDIIIWDSDTGKLLTPTPIKAHASVTYIRSLDFSPDGKTLVSGSSDHTTKLWNTETWQQRGNLIPCNAEVYSVRYSPSGELLAIATDSDIQIRDSGTRECKAIFKDHMQKVYVGTSLPLAWKPDGTLLSGGCKADPTIREWDLSIPGQRNDPWKGHEHDINAIAVNSDGTLVASASADHDVRLWRLWDRKTIAIFRHSSSQVHCVTFTADGKRILSGGDDKKVSEWTIPEHAFSDVKVCVYS
jgi:WD40 repeat protein